MPAFMLSQLRPKAPRNRQERGCLFAICVKLALPLRAVCHPKKATTIPSREKMALIITIKVGQLTRG
jgi:hypothetical protein